MSKKVLFIVLAALLLGCTTVGQKYDTSAINKIVIGKTTETDVISMVGEPISKRRLSNGVSIYEYEYGWKRLNEGTYKEAMEVQFYKGVVINKHEKLDAY